MTLRIVSWNNLAGANYFSHIFYHRMSYKHKNITSNCKEKMEKSRRNYYYKKPKQRKIFLPHKSVNPVKITTLIRVHLPMQIQLSLMGLQLQIKITSITS